jgi:DNA replication protein DnaC
MCNICRDGVVPVIENGLVSAKLCADRARCSTCGGTGDVEKEKLGWPVLYPCPACGFARRVVRALRSTSIPARHAGATKQVIPQNDYQSAAWKVVLAWIEDVSSGKTSRGILLHGDKGSGKSFLAAAALWEAALHARKMRTLRWVNTNLLADKLKELMEDRKSTDEDHVSSYLAKIHQADLCVLDEFSVFRTDWECEVMARLVQSRYDRNLPTIFTTMSSSDDIRDHLGDYGPMVVSRLREMTLSISCGSIDLRDRP